jgi:hypothetical protein
MGHKRRGLVELLDVAEPATKALPLPVRIRTLMSSSAATSAMAWANSARVLLFSAFIASGRLKVMMAIFSSFSKMMFS